MAPPGKTRRPRSVYDPTIGGDRLEKTGIFDRDPLAFPARLEDIRDQSDIRDPNLHGDERRQNVRWKYLILIVTVGILAIIIVASTGGKKSDRSSDQSNVASGPSSPNVPGISDEDPDEVLPPPPSNLAQLCSEESIESVEGLSYCQNACEKAECCNFPTSLSLSCLPGNVDICQEYHKSCWVLDDDVSKKEDNTDIEWAPLDIEQVCSHHNLATADGFNACKDICSKAECCYESGVDSCTEEPQCEGYSPCLFLKGVDHVHEDIEEEINDKCSSDKVQTLAGTQECESVCLQSICCFLPESECDIDDRDFCSQYQGCQAVMDAKIFLSELDPPPPDLHVLCSEESISTSTGRENCQEECDKASCCDIDPSLTESCLEGNHETCQEYHSSCWILDSDFRDEDSPELDPPPHNLHELCSEESISTSTGREYCQEECDRASCCDIDPSLIESCLEENHETCQEYHSSCWILDSDFRVEDSPELEWAPEHLELICSSQNLESPDGFDECKTICLEAKCCFASDVASCAFETACKSYSPCFMIKADLDAEDSDDEEQTISIQGSPTKAEVDEACGLIVLDECQEKCGPASCCFVPPSCSHMNREVDCGIYDSCEILY